MRSDGSLDPSIRENDSWNLPDTRTVALLEHGTVVTQNRIDGLRSSFSGYEKNRLFVSEQAQGFVDLSGVSGLDSDKDGRVFVKWDYNKDGWIDFAVVNTNRPLLQIFRNDLENQGQTGNFIAIRLVGGNRNSNPNPEWSNRNGFGAKIQLKAGDLKLFREHRCGEGMAAQNSQTIIVGVGPHEIIDELSVRWPSGKSQTVKHVRSGQLVIFDEYAIREDAAATGVKIGEYMNR